MAHGTFCTVIDCMDGRCQEMVSAWAKQHFGVEYPDTLTVAGADGVLLNNETEWIRTLAMCRISVNKHGATQAVIVGHSGCAGFIATPEEHREAIRNAVAKLASENFYEMVVGLFHDVDTNQLTEVCRIQGTLPITSTAITKADYSYKKR